jgi:hypothetical protein
VKWLILLVGVVVVCAVVAMILGLAGGGLGRPTSSLSHEPLPEDAVTDDDFEDLVFDVAVRGYRMSQVDGVIDRLRRELREKDEQIAVLRGGDGEPADATVQTELAEQTAPTEQTETSEQTESADQVETSAPTEPEEQHGPAKADTEANTEANTEPDVRAKDSRSA